MASPDQRKGMRHEGRSNSAQPFNIMMHPSLGSSPNGYSRMGF